jgi:hypothetical protein
MREPLHEARFGLDHAVHPAHLASHAQGRASGTRLNRERRPDRARGQHDLPSAAPVAPRTITRRHGR